MLLGNRTQLPIIPGVSPLTDSTELDTILFTAADKVRFQNGKLRKIKGWVRIFPQNNLNITGSARNIFSYRDSIDNPITVIGTNTRLFAYTPQNGDFFYNITPLNVTTIPLTNAFTTEYNSTVDVIVGTTNNSINVSLFIENYFEDGDLIKISGVTGGPYNGIPASAFNGTFVVFVVSNTQITINLASRATSTGDVVVNMTWAAQYLYVNYPANGLPLGDRVKILGSTDVDGIPAAKINLEFVISNIKDANNFVINTGVFATSFVALGGGVSTTIQTQIAAGYTQEEVGFGFGGGQFGAGDFGVGKVDNSIDMQFPRIWSMSNFGGVLVLTPGDPVTTSTDNLYYWENNVAVAPVLVSSSIGASGVPLACKWVYVSNNTVCVFGAGGMLNQFNSSDPGFYNSWTPGASTSAFQFIYQQAIPLISQAKSRNFDLQFTQSEVYLAEFIDKPDIWFIRKLFGTDGIIGPKARAIIEDAVFWMGTGDFYVFDGYTVNTLPNNTVKRYVYDNINMGQSYKCFCLANVEYSEVWFFYPFGNDTECNNYVMYNYKEGHFTTGTMNRSCAEEGANVNGNPYMVQIGNMITDPIPNSINTYFFSLSANPLTTIMSSATVTMAISPDVYFQAGDDIFISGAVDTNGIPAADINGIRTITFVATENGEFGAGPFGYGDFGGGGVGVQSIQFTAGASATSSGSGGGSAITVGTAIIGVQYSKTASVFVNEVVTIMGSSSVDGFPSNVINTTNPIRYIQGNIFQINVGANDVFSTSSVIGGGGAGLMLTVTDEDRLFIHEKGLNDYNNDFNVYTDPPQNQYAPILSYAQTNYVGIEAQDNTMLIYSFFSDISQKQNMTLTVNVKEFAQSSHVHTQNFTLTPTTTKVDPMMIGRVRQYTLTSNVLNGDFLIGKIFEEFKPSTPR